MRLRTLCVAVLFSLLIRPVAASSSGAWDRGFNSGWSPVTPADVQEWRGNLYTVAGFYSDYSSTTWDVHVWDGTEWSAVSGFSMGMLDAGEAAGVFGWHLDVHDGRLLAAASLEMRATSLERGYRGRVAGWDGSKWTNYGSDFDAWIDEIAVVGETPFALTRYTTNVSSIDDRIFGWDGSDWQPITGEGCDLGRFLASVDGELLVVGSLRTLSDETLEGVLAWDGAEWRQFAPVPASGEIRTLVEYAGSLTAGLYDRSSGGELVLRWTGSQWVPLGEGLQSNSDSIFSPSTISELWASGERLYACGRFRVEAGRAENVAVFDGESWQPYGGGTEGLSRTTESFTKGFARWRDHLLIYGEFSVANGRYVGGLAIDRGAGWQELRSGNGVKGSVAGFFEDENHLWALGNFVAAGGEVRFGIAQWDGSTWSEAPTEGSAGISDLAMHDGELFGAGRFPYTQADTTAYSPLGRLDGEVWKAIPGDWGDVTGTLVCSWDSHGVAVASYRYGEDLGLQEEVAVWDGESVHHFAVSGSRPQVRALVVHQGRLVVGGLLQGIGGSHALMIAAYDGQSWVPIGGGVGGEVSSLLSDGTSLYVGGHFKVVGGTVDARSVARWDGSAWSPMGDGFTSDHPAYGMSVAVVGALTLHRGQVIATGWFNRSGERTMVDLARWDGAAWQPFGNDPQTGIVRDRLDYALASWRGDLYVGGQIASVEGIDSRGIARWIEFGPSATAAGVGLHSVHPNPMNPRTTIDYEVTRAARVRLDIYDIRGRLITTLIDAKKDPGRYSVIWSGQDREGHGVASGVYFIRAEGPAGADRAKVTLIK